MPSSQFQLGRIVQQEFDRLLLMGSHGRIAEALPLTDDDQRDYKIHTRAGAWFTVR